MSPKTRWMLPAALLLASSTIASAQDTTPALSIFKDAGALKEACNSDLDEDLAACDWFIMGVWDTMGYMADFDVTERYVCTEEGTTVGELRIEVVAELASANLTTSAVSVTINALVRAYPCDD